MIADLSQQIKDAVTDEVTAQAGNLHPHLWLPSSTLDVTGPGADPDVRVDGRRYVGLPHTADTEAGRSVLIPEGWDGVRVDAVWMHTDGTVGQQWGYRFRHAFLTLREPGQPGDDPPIPTLVISTNTTTPAAQDAKDLSLTRHTNTLAVVGGQFGYIAVRRNVGSTNTLATMVYLAGIRLSNAAA